MPPFNNGDPAGARPYRARAATAARPIQPATTLPAPEVAVEVEVDLLAALEPEAVPVELAVESEEVPVAVAVDDLLELLPEEVAVTLEEKVRTSYTSGLRKQGMG